jgi:hypothetical protein
MEREEKVCAIEKATKKFYDRFQKEHAIFMSTIRGIEEPDEQKPEKRTWYTSVILNRLMFLYFLQRQGFLDTKSAHMRDGDTNYLRNRLRIVQEQYREDTSHTYYRSFLLRLFYAGLSKHERTPEIERLLGQVPYLHSELFSVHALERENRAIEIPDEAFERIFSFFDEFQWLLEHRPLSDERGINPEVLGHIFEKHINQQQMGAYYTREDVTAYIAKNSILPALFDAAARICPHIFGQEGALWDLLRHNPERYIADTIRNEQHLPGETEREYRERRAYYAQLRARIERGELCCIDDFITHNLTIEYFIQDVLHNIDEPEVMYLFYQCLTQMTILDPTCGSGAFLCSALRVLVPIYEACLAQMKIAPKTVGARFIAPSGEGGEWKINSAFNILKSIISTNLYGIDIMKEATELCKLRLFLLLVEAIDEDENIEALADVHFHIRAGNTLVGFAQTITLDHCSLDRMETNSRPYPDDQQSLDMLQSRLDRELARAYGIDVGDTDKFEQWRASHKPFHWKYEFTKIADRGGFDCIIGNPPYVEYREKQFPYRLQHFHTLGCGNLYPCVIERSRALLSQHGRLGMIMPLAAFATRNMIPLIEGVQQWFAGNWISFYHFRPSMLFSGGKVASIPTAILLTRIDEPEQKFSTSILKWATEQRHLLFSTLKYCRITASHDPANRHYYAKFGQTCENAIMEKVLQQRRVGDYLARTPAENRMFYRSAGGLYWKIFLNFPWPYQTTSNKQCVFKKEYEQDVFVALFNSSLFWWYYNVTFDTFNLKDYMLFGFRFTYPEDSMVTDALCEQCERLMEDFRRNAKHLKRGETGSYTMYARKSKHILDDIDAILAQHYGLSGEELDFIVHYDIKYRMGSGKM